MTLTGPDLSHWQGSVNFGAIRRAGHSLVILKATDGAGNVDPSFPANRAAAHAAGLAVGAYHFAEGGDPIAEAEHFCAVTDPLAVGELVVLDWEVTGSDPVGWCKAWLDHIAAKCNVRPLLYINQATRDGFNWAPVAKAGHGLWLAKYDNSLTQPSSGAWPAVAMKQYTDKGTVPGVSSPCDVNVFYGDATALAALGHNPTPTPPPEDPLPSVADVVKGLLDAQVDPHTGTVLQTLRDARLIARRAEQAADGAEAKVDALAAKVDALIAKLTPPA